MAEHALDTVAVTIAAEIARDGLAAVSFGRDETFLAGHVVAIEPGDILDERGFQRCRIVSYLDHRTRQRLGFAALLCHRPVQYIIPCDGFTLAMALIIAALPPPKRLPEPWLRRCIYFGGVCF